MGHFYLVRRKPDRQVLQVQAIFLIARACRPRHDRDAVLEHEHVHREGHADWQDNDHQAGVECDELVLIAAA